MTTLASFASVFDIGALYLLEKCKGQPQGGIERMAIDKLPAKSLDRRFREWRDGRSFGLNSGISYMGL